MFPEAPLRSRTVGFPQAGSDLGLPAVAFPREREASALTPIHPFAPWVTSTGAPLSPGPPCPGTPGAAKCPEPLCTIPVLPLSAWCRAPWQWALPPFHRAYGLMRQSSPLPPPRLYPRTVGPCRLLSAPAGWRPFPTLFCASVPACLAPYPGGSWRASTRCFLHALGLPPVRTGAALRIMPYSAFRTELYFRAAVIP